MFLTAGGRVRNHNDDDTSPVNSRSSSPAGHSCSIYSNNFGCNEYLRITDLVVCSWFKKDDIKLKYGNR